MHPDSLFAVLPLTPSWNLGVCTQTLNYIPRAIFACRVHRAGPGSARKLPLQQFLACVLVLDAVDKHLMHTGCVTGVKLCETCGRHCSTACLCFPPSPNRATKYPNQTSASTLETLTKLACAAIYKLMHTFKQVWHFL